MRPTTNGLSCTHMSLDRYTLQGSIRDFQDARLRAALRNIFARVTRRSDDLLAYEDVAEQLRLSARSDRGIQTIPVASIVGSVGRAADFTRTFLPRRAVDEERWARVHQAFINPQGTSLPPIEVYQVGEAYFVLDGNHRVSVARREGVKFIEAHVVEIQTAVPFTPDVQPNDLIVKAEYAEFLEATGLGDPNLEFDLSVSACGLYRKLAEQIARHQYSLRRAQGRKLSYQEAAADWIANVYAPLALAIRERGLLRWFPDSTETDLYLWVSEHREQLEQELNWAIRPDAAVTDLVVRARARAKRSEMAPGAWRSQRLVERYLEHLFRDLLVPLRDTTASWDALEQALVIAQRENASIHGLHLVRAETEKATAAIRELGARFHERCAAANVTGNFAVETGSVTRKICERALLADLIVMGVREEGSQAPNRATTSHWRSLLKSAARPLLAVPSTRPLQRALLLFDGSPKAREALFVAAYMAENWKTALTVLTPANGAPSSSALEYARAYLDLHELAAEYVEAPSSSTMILEMMAERALDLVLMGSAGASAWQPLRGGSMTEMLLRSSPCPLLICP